MLPMMMPYGQKEADIDASSKYRDALGVFNIGGVSMKHFAKLFQGGFKNPFVVYGCFLIAVVMVHYCLGGNFIHAEGQTQLTIVSAIVENLGLLILRLKIQRKESVAGISGTTMTMYTMTYALRSMLLIPDFSWSALDEWTQCVLTLASLLMALDVRRSVFVRHKGSYQEHLDVMKVKYLVPGLLVVAAVLHPGFSVRGTGFLWTFSWTSCLYIDVMALMPQVVMMAKGEGMVDAMISHFVAATVVSRMCDLAFWLCAGFAWLEQPGVFNYSGWLIISVHVLHLLLVADFMYYHVKAYLSGASLSQDMSLDL